MGVGTVAEGCSRRALTRKIPRGRSHVAEEVVLVVFEVVLSGQMGSVRTNSVTLTNAQFDITYRV
eukprot:1189152-Prorocentrum_minimum.AAC.5